MNDLINDLNTYFDISWSLLLAQAFVLGLFILAARAIVTRGRGLEVPVWLVLAFFIPVIFPSLALIHFRSSRSPKSASGNAAI